MKRYIVLILVVALAACLFVGCGNNEAATDPTDSTAPESIDATTPESIDATTPENTDSTVPESTDSGTRTITDGVGREVEIPASVERIVPLGNTPRMITYLGLADKVVGISGFNADTLSPLQAYAYAKKDLWGELPVVGTDAGGATDYYPEEIISVQPDVVLCTYTAELADDIQRQTGVPVVAVPMGTLFREDYEQALRILGDVCGVKERAEEVITYIHDCLDDLGTRASGVPDADKPTALAAAATYKGAHGIEGVYSKYAVFAAVAANDVADGISDSANGVLVDKEQIIGWNPEIIFFDYSGVSLVQTDYEANPDFYAQLTAVQADNLYQYPNSTYYFSNVEIPIVNSYYVGSTLYPEQFADIVFADKANEIFAFFLGDGDYLSKLKSIGAGYGKVTLGND